MDVELLPVAADAEKVTAQCRIQEVCESFDFRRTKTG
jgi:hypothetical protein